MTLKKSKKSSKKPEPWKTQPKGLPRWVRAVPMSPNHGSGDLQKRLWKLCSDFVRIRDFYRYKGVCVATGKVLERWKDGQAGHFISYSHCNGMFKFDTRNIHLQGAQSNGFGGREDWQQYEATLIERYGVQYINNLEDENKNSSPKFTNEQIVDRMRDLVLSMLRLQEQPDYIPWVVELMGVNNQVDYKL